MLQRLRFRGGMLVLTGLILFPPLNRLLREWSHGMFSRGATLVLVILLFLGTFGFGRVADEMKQYEGEWEVLFLW